MLRSSVRRVAHHLIGLVGLIDPPRPEAIAAVAECHSAGIRVKMITGDHAGTAAAIARQIGLKKPERVLTGTDLERMDDAELAAVVVDSDVFARTSPEHKLRLVTALQARGLTVAMTGDGVNDAPALKRADAGVAMGQKGSEAAKEASELVLADDNFASIAAAVREGRTVYDNIKKVISWTLPTNAGESMTIVVALFLGMALPITAVQILWVNLITAITLGIALACDLRVATEKARFGITPAKLGLVYPLHDVKLLTDLVGPGQAKRILYTGSLIDAAEAQRWRALDLVNVVELRELALVGRHGVAGRLGHPDDRLAVDRQAVAALSVGGHDLAAVRDGDAFDAALALVELAVFVRVKEYAALQGLAVVLCRRCPGWGHRGRRHERGAEQAGARHDLTSLNRKALARAPACAAPAPALKTPERSDDLRVRVG